MLFDIPSKNPVFVNNGARLAVAQSRDESIAIDYWIVAISAAERKQKTSWIEIHLAERSLLFALSECTDINCAVIFPLCFKLLFSCTLKIMPKLKEVYA